MSSLLLCSWKRVFAINSVFFWKNSINLALLHSVFQGQICLLLQVFLDFLLLHSSPLSWKQHLFWLLLLKGLVGLHRTVQLQLLWQCRSGREELPHIRGQGWWPRGATPHPRSSCCTGTRGLRGATPHSRLGGANSSKVRSSDCTLLEQPWRDTPCPR